MQWRVIGFLLVIGHTNVTLAQLPNARLNWVFPPGGKVGQSHEVTAQGDDLDGPQLLEFSHPGITSVPKSQPTDFIHLRPRPIPNQFVVSVADTVPEGMYEVRLQGHYGTTNSRPFHVTRLKEIQGAPDNHTVTKSMSVAVNSIVSGQIDGQKTDYYKVNLKAGQTVHVEVFAHRIDSRADATLSIRKSNGRILQTSRNEYGNDPSLAFVAPQDGAYVIGVYDFLFNGGDQYFYRLAIHERPHVEFALPMSGQRGHDIEMTLYGHNLPNAQATKLTTKNGTPLQKSVVRISMPSETQRHLFHTSSGFLKPRDVSTDGFPYQYQTDSGSSNPIWLGLASHDVAQETEPNNQPDAAQEIAVPGETVGQFFPQYDDDWFVFSAKKGDRFWIEVVSHRLGSNTDPFLLLQRVTTDANGKQQVAFLSEQDDPGNGPGWKGYRRPTRDPRLKLDVPEDGQYRVLVRDLANSESRPNPGRLYRLIVRKPAPSFELLVSPKSPWDPDNNQPKRWSSVLRPGGTLTVPVLVARKDGFGGAIKISLEGLPDGVSFGPDTVEPGKNQVTLVFTATEETKSWSGPVAVVGIARIGDQEVRQTACYTVTAWDANGANDLASTRMTDHFELSVLDEPSAIAVEFRPRNTESGEAVTEKLEVPRTGKLTVPFSISKKGEVNGKIALGATNVPKGIKAEVKVADDQQGGQINFTVEPGAPIGRHAFFLSGKPKLKYRRNPQAAERAQAEKQRVEKLVAQLNEAHDTAAHALESIKAEVAKSAANSSQSTDEDPRLTEGEKKLAAATQQRDQAKAALKVATETAQKLSEAANPADRQAYITSPSATLHVTEAPIRFEVAGKTEATSKGSTAEFLVTIERLYGFADTVSFQLLLPGGLVGLEAESIQLAKDAKTGMFRVRVTNQAPEGDHRCSIRASLSFNGLQLNVDRGLVLRVTKALPE